MGYKLLYCKSRSINWVQNFEVGEVHSDFFLDIQVYKNKLYKCRGVWFFFWLPTNNYDMKFDNMWQLQVSF
jgi:hypothetical protein